jgi:hypothetical protein
LAERTAADAERADQLADLRAAVAASTQQPALPDGYIVPTPVDLAALHDPTFSDGLIPSQHRDVLAGGAGTRGSAPNDDELLRTYGVAKRDHCYEGPIDDWPKRAERAATVHGLRTVLARWGAIEPVPVSDPPGPKDCDAKGRCWLCGKIQGDWRLVDPANFGPSLKYAFSHWLPYWAIPQPQTGDVQP